MHVLVAGAGGMLGSAIRRTVPPDAHLASLTHGDCDITDKEAVSSAEDSPCASNVTGTLQLGFAGTQTP